MTEHEKTRTGKRAVKYDIADGMCPFDGNELGQTDDILPTDDVPENDEGGDWPYFLHCLGCGNLFTPTGLVVDQNP